MRKRENSPKLAKLSRVICCILLIAFVLPLLLSATVPRVAASPDKNWVTPSATTASSEGEMTLLENFEDVTDWTYSEVDTNGKITGGQVTDWKTEGTFSYKINATTGAATGDYGKLGKTFDFTGIKTLKVDVKYAVSTWTHAEIYAGTTELWGDRNISGESTLTLDVSGISGSKELFFRVRFEGNGAGSGYFYFDNSWALIYTATNTKDDNTATQWRPDPANETGAWINWDLGSIKGVSGCRIYWGANVTYRPTAYRIQTSTDNSSWTTVVTETQAAPASAWKEYSWTKASARYIKLIVDTHGASGTEIYEMDAEVNYTPTIVSITVNNSLVDRKLDYSGSGAVTTTTITIRVQDNDGYSEIQPIRLWIRDKNGSVVVDNVKITDNTANATTLDFTYTFDCPDNLPNDNLGAFDVNVVTNDIWGASATNNWGGVGATLFTVDDLKSTINFSPTSPYVGYDLIVSGTISRIVGSDNADDVKLIDNRHGTFALGAGNSWSKTYTITKATFGENVGVVLRAKDLPLDGENNSSYLVNSNMIYKIEVRRENDYALWPGIPIENRPMVVKFNWEGGTQSKTLENNSETITIASGGKTPFLVSLTDNNQYWRRRIPQAGGGTLTFVLPENNATIDQYIMTVTDYTDIFDAPDGWVSLRIYIDNAFAVINDDWWDATNHAYAFLVLHNWYEVYLFGASGAQRHIGHIQAETDTTLDPFVAVALEFGEYKVFKYGVLEFEATRNNVGHVVMRFRDAHDNTDNVIWRVYTLDDTFKYQDNFAYPSEIEATWPDADNNTTYKIEIQVSSREFGTWSEWYVVGPIIAPLPYTAPGIGGILGTAMPLAGLAGLFFIGVVAMSFGARYASTAMLGVAIGAMFLKFLSYKMAVNLMPLSEGALILLLVMAIAWNVGERL